MDVKMKKTQILTRLYGVTSTTVLHHNIFKARHVIQQHYDMTTPKVYAVTILLWKAKISESALRRNMDTWLCHHGFVGYPLTIVMSIDESPKLRSIRPRPCDYSFDEWLKVKIGHNNINNSYREIVFNEWILDDFNVEEEYAKEIGNPYSRRFDEYKRVFNNEVEQLSNEYILRVGKKRYSMDDVWEKYEQYHRKTKDTWHDEGFEEDELW
ncbi:hypothetical protein Tco_0206548 [Tanacetum coccineum]